VKRVICGKTKESCADIPHERSFTEKKNGWWGANLSEILGQDDLIGAKSLIFSLLFIRSIAPQVNRNT